MTLLTVIIAIVLAAAGIWALVYSAAHIADDVQTEEKHE